MSKHLVEVCKEATMPDGTKRILFHLESGIKLYLSHKDFMNVIDNSSLGFKNLQLEEATFLTHGGVLIATLLDKVKGSEYIADDNSTLVKEGAHAETEVIRNGKKLKLKIGDKALKGDLCYTYVDGIRIDRTAAFCIEPSGKRRLELKADRRDAERELQAMKEELGVF